MVKMVTVQFNDKHSQMIREMCGEYRAITDFVSEIVSKEYHKKKDPNE